MHLMSDSVCVQMDTRGVISYLLQLLVRQHYCAWDDILGRALNP
jgi:hypothetical protein